MFRFVDQSAFEAFNCFFEIEVGNQNQKYFMEMPRVMLEKEFISLVQQAAQHSVPTRIKMGRLIPIWNQLEQKWIEIENSIEFENLPYVHKCDSEAK